MTQRPISEDDLHAYIDDALPPARREEVEAYLATHADVEARVAAYRRQHEALRSALAPVTEEPIPSALNLSNLVERRRAPRSHSWRDAAAAVVLLAIGLVGGWVGHGRMVAPAEGIVALADEATSSYAAYAPDQTTPSEMSGANRPGFVAWASRQLKRDVTVPDLSASGYRFMGGRLVTTAYGRAIMLMYADSAGTRLTMFTRRMRIDRNTRMARQSSGSLNGFSWASKGIGYSVVAPLAPDILHPVANEIRRQVTSST